jgi:hypothetical protein
MSDDHEVDRSIGGPGGDVGGGKTTVVPVEGARGEVEGGCSTAKQTTAEPLRKESGGTSKMNQKGETR